MGGTKDYVPQDAVVELDDQRSYFDLGAYILAVLRDEWDTSKTDGAKPNIVFKEDMKGVAFRGQDWVELSQTGDWSQAVSAGYGFENLAENVTIEIHTTKSRQHTVKMNEEIRRIIHNHRKDPLDLPPKGVSGRRWLEWYPNQQTFDRSNVGYFRRIGKVTMNWRYRQVG